MMKLNRLFLAATICATTFLMNTISYAATNATVSNNPTPNVTPNAMVHKNIIIPPMHPSIGFPDVYQPTNFGNSLLIDEHSAPVTYGQVTLIGLNLNNSGNKITVESGQLIPATVVYVYDCPTCKEDSINQIIIGIDKVGAQACLYDGASQGKGIADFILTAPTKPGTYDIRFRYAQAWGCSEALKNWWGVDHAPAADAIVGTIIVK